MGFKMEDIHSPTVPSGSAGNPSAQAGSEEKSTMMELFAEKDRLEGELTALGGVLESHGVNMNTSLTTFDGFPRDDLDIAQIRTTRSRIIYLRNDYKAIMARIEKALHAHHASNQTTETTTAKAITQPVATSSASRAAAESIPLEKPFAKVNSVVAGSPADDAGLKAGDSIRRFGNVNWINHEKLKKVADMVQSNEGRSIVVVVTREASEGETAEELCLTLTPRRNWGGRGMLGCHLLPA